MTDAQILIRYQIQLMNFLNDEEAIDEFCYVKRKAHLNRKRLRVKEMVLDELRLVGKFIEKIELKHYEK